MSGLRLIVPDSRRPGFSALGTHDLYAPLNLHLWPLRDALSWAVNWEPMGKLQSELIINPGRVTLECAMLRVPLWRGTNWEQP